MSTPGRFQLAKLAGEVVHPLTGEVDNSRKLFVKGPR
jgi:hypothetical protein